MQKVMMQHVEHDTKVTFVGRGWCVRILLNGEVNQESFVTEKDEIHQAIQEMLRMEDKCGNWSNMADRARHRPTEKQMKYKS
jgi:hypothetical protein